MLIKEVVAQAEGLFQPSAPPANVNKPPLVLTAAQQQQALRQSRKRKLSLLIAKKQQQDRHNALHKVTAQDKLAAFVAAQNL